MSTKKTTTIFILILLINSLTIPTIIGASNTIPSDEEEDEEIFFITKSKSSPISSRIPATLDNLYKLFVISKFKINCVGDPLPVHQIVWGYIEYSDDSWVPSGVPVTLTDLDNGNDVVVYTSTSESGQTGVYLYDVWNLGAEDGDTILVNVSYGGCIGNNSVIINSSVPPQRCDVTIYGNLPPVIPSQPSGPTSGYINTTYNYSTSTWDPDGDDIYYWFDWDDDSNSGWIGPYSSNETCNSSHSWGETGTYQVKAKAKDEHGAELGTLWSDPLNVTIFSPNNPPNTPSNPNPYDGETDVDVDHNLSWTGGDPDPGDNVTYDVYFEADDPTPDVLVSDNQSGTTYDPGTMNGNTQYYWQIVAWDDHGASTTGSIWSFTTENNPPNSPSDPEPEDGATDVDIEADLSWNCSDPDGDSLTYNVYFEANDPTPDILVSENQTGTTYDPGTMEHSTHYYWQIVAWDNHGASTEGPIWDFTTMSEPNDPPYPPTDPNPENGSTDVDIDADLNWSCDGDPDPGDWVSYKVFFEANNPDPEYILTTSQTIYDPGTMEFNTTYYWKIVVKDNHGATTSGPVWHFTTEAAPVPDLDCDGSLGWTNVEPGSTVTGSFTVKNIGGPLSELDWEIIEWPNWGTWTFTPISGDDLTPEEGQVTAQVTVVAPNQQNQEFTGNVKVVNSENSSDYEIIPASLVTPVNQQSSIVLSALSTNLMTSSLLSRLISIKMLFLQRFSRTTSSNSAASSSNSATEDIEDSTSGSSSDSSGIQQSSDQSSEVNEQSSQNSQSSSSGASSDSSSSESPISSSSDSAESSDSSSSDGNDSESSDRAP